MLKLPQTFQNSGQQTPGVCSVPGGLGHDPGVRGADAPTTHKSLHSTQHLCSAQVHGSWEQTISFDFKHLQTAPQNYNKKTSLLIHISYVF